MGSGIPLGKGLRNMVQRASPGELQQGSSGPAPARCHPAVLRWLRNAAPSPISLVLLETQKHQAGKGTLGRNEHRGNPTKCCISPGRGSSTPLTQSASTTASVLEEGNPQAGGTNGKELSSSPPDGSCHGKIPLAAPLRELCWEHLWGVRQDMPLPSKPLTHGRCTQAPTPPS